MCRPTRARSSLLGSVLEKRPDGAPQRTCFEVLQDGGMPTNKRKHAPKTVLRLPDLEWNLAPASPAFMGEPIVHALSKLRVKYNREITWGIWQPIPPILEVLPHYSP